MHYLIDTFNHCIISKHRTFDAAERAAVKHQGTGLIMEPETRLALAESLKQAFIRDDDSLSRIVERYNRDQSESTPPKPQRTRVWHNPTYPNDFEFVLETYVSNGETYEWRRVFNGAWVFSENSQTWASHT